MKFLYLLSILSFIITVYAFPKLGIRDACQTCKMYASACQLQCMQQQSSAIGNVGNQGSAGPIHNAGHIKKDSCGCQDPSSCGNC